MKLTRTVKVGRITNLSDARYCSGMGVHMLGFNTIPDQPGYVSPETYQSIRGWFAGPSVVAEVYGLRDAETMHSILRDYLPDFVELSLSELPFIALPSLSLIVTASGIPVEKLIAELGRIQTQVAYVLADQNLPAESIAQIAVHYPVLLKLTGMVESNLLELPVHGFALEGTSEEKPGLKSYDDLAGVLEKLSED